MKLMETAGRRSSDSQAAKRLRLGSWSMPLPASRFARMAVGIALIVGGILGFLPVLGFWMIPVGLLVLSHDVAAIRRFRRRSTLWWARRRARKRDV